MFFSNERYFQMKDWLITWFKAARAPFLVVSLLPALVGGAMAHTRGYFNTLHFILAVVGIVMAHSAADFIDDYFDFKKGNLGNKVQQFHDSPLIDGKVTLNQVLVAISLCLVIAFACGLYLLLEVGLPVVVLALIGLFIVFFYTSPPVRLNYRGLGETMLFLAFGAMIVVGVYYVLSGHFALEPLLISFMPGVFTMNVGLVSNTFDVPDDIKSGKRTLPVRFGQANAVRFMAVTSTLAYLSIIIAALMGIAPLWTLLVLLTVPLAVNTVQHASRFTDESHYTPAMTRAIALSSLGSLLLLVAYLI
jgi:1,4-dihydroxy-2-naphthoate octaprenyltransferase